jgi:hypothetical protein
LKSSVPLWSHNMPLLLTGTVHVTNSLKDIYSSTYTLVWPHGGLARYDTNWALCNVMSSRHDAHYCTLYDNITTEFTNQALCKFLQTICHSMSTCSRIAIILIPFLYLLHISQSSSAENRDLTVKRTCISFPCECHHNTVPAMVFLFF